MGRFGSGVRLWKPKALELIQANENVVNGSLVSYILISLQLCKRYVDFSILKNFYPVGLSADTLYSSSSSLQK